MREIKLFLRDFPLSENGNLCYYKKDVVKSPNSATDYECFSCPPGTIGSFVTIEQLIKEYLAICHIKVHGQLIGKQGMDEILYL